jgi:predicted AAA+ superfamily ATPase
MFERSELQEVRKRVNEERRFIQVISGPRQVGKTTLITQLLGKISFPSLYESADAVPAGNALWIDQIWDNARLLMQSRKSSQFLLVIDEIQKISNWSETVKKNWDYDSLNKINLKVILLGSSRLLVQQGLTESLAGRFENIVLSHWSFNEINSAFGLDANNFAWFGGYPGSVDILTDEIRWKKYIRDSLIETSISKDILMLTRIDKPALLKNLFELGSLFSGQVLSYNKMLGQLQDAGNTTTLSHYLKLLGSAGLITGIEKYSLSAVRTRSSSPKFQVYNNAILSSQSPMTFSDVRNNHSEWGRVVESAVGAHLLNESLKGNISLYYWRERNEEVDFVVEKNEKVIAIEVKSTYIKNKRGLTSFQKRFNPFRTICIDEKIFPWHEFIKINPADLF